MRSTPMPSQPVTFDLYDQDDYLRYLEYAAIQTALYGGLYLTFNENHVTVHDALTVTIRKPDDDPPAGNAANQAQD